MLFANETLLAASGSGEISKGEWSDIFCAEFQGTCDQAQKVFSKLDKDSSGDISLAEVISLFADMDSDGESDEGGRVGGHSGANVEERKGNWEDERELETDEMEPW